MTRIKMKFVFAATSDLSKVIDFYEQQKVHVHNAREKLELMSQLRKCVVDEVNI